MRLTNGQWRSYIAHLMNSVWFRCRIKLIELLAGSTGIILNTEVRGIKQMYKGQALYYSTRKKENK